MKKLLSHLIPVTQWLWVIALAMLGGCSTPPYRLVYSSGFTFARYDFIVVAKPDNATTSSSLYGFDIEFANLMARYNMKIVGDKEFETLTPAEKRQTLLARMSLIATNKKKNLISISFDDGVSGKTVASVTAEAKGNMFDTSDRTKAFEAVTDALLQALEHDKGLSVSDANASKGR